MTQRAALVTGSSSGIGLAIAHVLGDEGYALTIAARRQEKLTVAADELRAKGYDVQAVTADVANESEIKNVVENHQKRYGRLDVLVNNAGVGIGAPVAEVQTKHLDLQIAINLRAVFLFYRECVAMLRAAGAEHRSALVVNTASIAGKSGQAWLSAYSATKFGVVGYAQAMNKELSSDGIKSVALCPGFVATPMTEWANDRISPADMIQPQDIAEAVRFLLHLSPNCIVPELVFQRPGV